MIGCIDGPGAGGWQLPGHGILTAFGVCLAKDHILTSAMILISLAAAGPGVRYITNGGSHGPGVDLDLDLDLGSWARGREAGGQFLDRASPTYYRNLLILQSFNLASWPGRAQGKG